MGHRGEYCILVSVWEHILESFGEIVEEDVLGIYKQREESKGKGKGITSQYNGYSSFVLIIIEHIFIKMLKNNEYPEWGKYLLNT